MDVAAQVACHASFRCAALVAFVWCVAGLACGLVCNLRKAIGGRPLFYKSSDSFVFVDRHMCFFAWCQYKPPNSGPCSYPINPVHMEPTSCN